MKSSFLLLILFIICCNNATSQSGNWIKYHTTNDIDLFYDSESITYYGDKVYIWELQIVPEGTYDSFGYVSYNLLRIELSCTTMKYKTVADITYYKEGKSIENTYSSEIYVAEPGSSRAKLINLLCK